MFPHFLDYFPLKICLHEVCISFYLKEGEFWLLNCKIYIFILQFVLSWSYLEDRWALVLGHVMHLQWGLGFVMQCNAVYHDGPEDQYHDCLSPCTQKYRLLFRVKLIFSISEEAGDHVTRERFSWPPPVPHISQDGDLRVCQGNFTDGDRFAKWSRAKSLHWVMNY